MGAANDVTTLGICMSCPSSKQNESNRAWEYLCFVQTGPRWSIKIDAALHLLCADDGGTIGRVFDHGLSSVCGVFALGNRTAWNSPAFYRHLRINPCQFYQLFAVQWELIQSLTLCQQVYLSANLFPTRERFCRKNF